MTGTTAGTLDGELAEFDHLFVNVLDWLPGLWDRERGGFYYALSSTGASEFEADIESTAFAVNIIARAGLLGSLPRAVRTALVRFFQDRQDRRSGYFLDPQNEMREIERLRGRALDMATSALARLGAEPLYPLPDPGTGATAYTRHVESVDAFEEWLDQRPWENSWLAQDNIQAQAALLMLLPDSRRDALVGTAIRYVSARQDPVTGFAGEGVPYNRLSGAFKFALFCRQVGHAVPRAREIYDAAFEVIRTQECTDACWLRNPVELIDVVGAQLGGVGERDVAELVRITTANSRGFARDDGGFSRHLGHSLEAPNEVRLGFGLDEGDLNATHQFVTTVRPTLYRLAGVAAPALSIPDGWADRFQA
ncbi:hypothetical protein [Promicromonospora sp. NPDC057488]|uniref:hypothetical protein n=1 Tax=Promicromonospora sp. NPDC057488 TaxID=3346147 RepID=UPI00366E90CB